MTVSRSSAVMVCIGLLAGAPQPAAAQEPVAPSDQCLKTIWAPSNEEICAKDVTILRDANATHDRSLDDRKLCGEGPDGETVIEYIQHAGQEVSLLHANPRVQGLAADAARLQVRMLVPGDYDFWSTGRFAAGLRIGDPAKPGKCYTGGCVSKKQNGSMVEAQYAVRRGVPYLKIYSYHLNRTTKVVDNVSNWEGKNRKRSQQFGQGPEMDTPLPTGHWINVVLDVQLNSFDKSGRPLADGMSRIAMYDDAGELVDSATLERAIYRTDPAWKIIRPELEDKTHKHKPAPATQSMYFSDYVLSVPDPSVAGCNARAFTGGLDSAAGALGPPSSRPQR